MTTGEEEQQGDEAKATVVLDPRMRQRREEVREEESRRRRHRLRRLLVPVGAVAILFGLTYTPLLAVGRVEVQGMERTPDSAVVEAAGIRPGHRILTLDERGAERRVEALPWVNRADVIRSWPRTVQIEVTERAPAATAVVGVPEGPPGMVAWVDETGRVLQAEGEPIEGLVTVVGLEQLPPAGNDLPPGALDALAIAAAAPRRVPGALATVTVDLEGVIAAGFPGAGARVLFRNGEDIEEKLVALDTILKNVDVSCLATVDLWVPDAPSLTHSC